MTATDLPYAIEALGFDEESISIRKHMEYHNNILRCTFHRHTLHNKEGVGSRFEGLEAGVYGKSTLTNTTDMDFVQYYHRMILMVATISDMGHKKLDEMTFSVNDLTIIPCSNFPGYVYLQLPQPILLFNFLPNEICDAYMLLQQTIIDEIKTVKTTQNGPAHTQYLDYGGVPNVSKIDTVKCLLLKYWPIEACKWANRYKPNKWPSKKLIEKIKSKGFTLAPIGHIDCSEQKFQWRIGIRGEKELFANLNQTQILCYTALKLILKADIQNIHEEALSSYHMKNVVFWCAEQDSCHWTKENFEICAKTCINRLINFISLKQFPHYFIEDRNLINSRMTSEIKKQIIKALTKYSNDILAILSFNFFDELRTFTQFKADLLQCAKQKSIINSCIAFYLEPYSYFYGLQHVLWETYQGHSTEINLKNAQDILYILEKTKRHFICHHIAYAKNMLGLLCYSRYNQTRCQKDILKARKLLMSSLTFENISLKLRVAAFLLMENDCTNCINVCSAFLRNPAKYKSLHEKIYHAQTVLTAFRDLVDMSEDNVNKLTALKGNILEIFYNKCISDHCGDGGLLQGNIVLSQIQRVREIDDHINELTEYDILEIVRNSNKLDLVYFENYRNDSILLLFKNFTNLVFSDMSFNIPYLASEKWAVPEVIKYELCSVQMCHPESSLYGIYIDPMLYCLVLTFLCYHETKKWIKRDVMLTKMDEYIDKYSKLSESGKPVPAELPHSLPLYRVYNIVAYCCVKAKRYQQCFNYILNSLKLYGERQNTAFGYTRCVCKILNSLYVNQYLQHNIVQNV